MTPQEVTVIGTRMSLSEMEAFLGFTPDILNNELNKLAREICVVRGYFNKTTANKIKFYRLGDVNIEELTNGIEVMVKTLKTGNQWKPDIVFMFRDYKEVQALVNSKYPYGSMNQETRIKYVADFSEAIGDKFRKVNLLE